MIIQLILASILTIVGFIIFHFAVSVHMNHDPSAHERNKLRTGGFLNMWRGRVQSSFADERNYQVALGLKVKRKDGKLLVRPQGRISDEAALSALNKR